MKGRNLIYVLVFAALIAVGVFAMVQNSGWVKQYFGDYKAALGIIAGALGFLLKFLQPAVKVVDNAFRRLSSLNNTVNGLKEEARKKFISDQDDLNKKLAAAQTEAQEKQKNIELLQAQQKKLQSDIDDITSGRKIIRFIEGRVTDARYINSLGIISWVRKDFEQLDILLRQQKDAKSKTEAAGTIAFELERIILYVDDLDRCNEEIVVRVLEAIHLLLAFPLFVVVVGVDPRWMHRALNVQYAKLLSGTEENEKNKIITDVGHPATSYDYLEKIFQIPFALKPIDNTGKAKLIKSQLEKAKPTESIPPPDKPPVTPPGPLPGTVLPDQPPIPDDPNPGNGPLPDKPAGELPKVEIVKPETLVVSKEEIEFVEEMAFLIGDSPRTIKRYTNIYRIIRTHKNFNKEGGEEMNYYIGAIILLSIITGMPEDSPLIFDKVKDADKDSHFKDFLAAYSVSKKDPENKLAILKKKIKAGEFKLSNKIDHLIMRHLQANLNLVSRFSFRNIA